MKRLFTLFAFIFLLLFLLTACGDQAAQDGVTPPEGTIDLSGFTAQTPDGDACSGEIFSGHKLTMLNIWGTFCGPCIREMPDLAQISREYGQSLQVIGIIIDAVDKNFNPIPVKKDAASDILAQTGVDYLQLLPSPSLNDLLLSEVQVFPTTYFVDENGFVIGEAYYGSRDHDTWKSIIDAYLEARS